MKRLSLLVTLSALALGSTATMAHAQYLDLTTLTPGTNGAFTGTLNGVAVTGAITANDGSFQFFGVGAGFNQSTLDNSSPQYSYSNIYSPSTPLTDRVGYQNTGGNSTITVVFGAAITNPVFQIANLDGAAFNFSSTVGLTGVVLLSQNGPGSLAVDSSNTLFNPGSGILGLDPSTPPPTSGNRSGYGSAELLGTFTTLTIRVGTNTSGDSGSFTLSTSPAAVPEPGSIALLVGMGITGAGFLARKRRK